jgi:hypothetical protein
VGALKQANVGLALLSGYGNTNTTGVDGTTEEKAGGSTAEDELNNQSQLLKTRSARATAKVQKLLNEKRLELTQKVQKEWLQEALAARKAKGESGVFMYVVVGVGGGGGGVVGGGVWCGWWWWCLVLTLFFLFFLFFFFFLLLLFFLYSCFLFLQVRVRGQGRDAPNEPRIAIGKPTVAKTSWQCL